MPNGKARLKSLGVPAWGDRPTITISVPEEVANLILVIADKIYGETKEKSEPPTIHDVLLTDVPIRNFPDGQGMYLSDLAKLDGFKMLAQKKHYRRFSLYPSRNMDGATAVDVPASPSLPDAWAIKPWGEGPMRMISVPEERASELLLFAMTICDPRREELLDKGWKRLPGLQIIIDILLTGVPIREFPEGQGVYLSEFRSVTAARNIVLHVLPPAPREEDSGVPVTSEPCPLEDHAGTLVDPIPPYSEEA